ncbi:MAG: CDP-alcohol phosphatidyltransferase family protein, partial [Oscillospiraceae bacterium]|nr:CDP-alcohol phosphatidyltransferase family protein [Oscillospiraceae bacterium]
MDLKQFKGQAFTIPNILSYIRFALIPVFVVIFALAAENSRLYVTAAAVVIVSGATDLLDGFIARRCNQVTALGRVLDPFADKLTSI